MELTIANFDKDLIPSYRALGVTYSMLLQFRDGSLDDALAEIGVERQELSRLKNRYLAAARLDDGPADHFDLCVLAFLLASSAGYTEITRHGFEAAIATELKRVSKPYLVPFWVPSVAALGQRSLFMPIVAPRKGYILQAYEGLVRHIRQLTGQGGELSRTAILWRVAALVDGLEPGDRNLYDKMNAVRGRIVQSDVLSETEKRLWNPLTKQFSDRRHALTHLAIREGETFETASQYALTSYDDLVSVSTALGFAVLHEVANDLAAMPPPAAEWQHVWANTEWIEDQL